MGKSRRNIWRRSIFSISNGIENDFGLQQDDFTGLNKVIACAKHLIAGSDPINGLNLSPMDISQRTLNEIFLPWINNGSTQ